MMSKLLVMISGSGTNLEALLVALPGSGIDATVVAVGADRYATGLAHATARSIPTFVVAPRDFPDRDSWGDALGEKMAEYEPDWIILSGFMRLLPPGVVERFSPRLINTHPAFLPEFPGANGVRDALLAGVSQTGASVITVDSGVDSGPLLARQRVPILPGDTEEVLHERIKIVERQLLLDVLRDLVSPGGNESSAQEKEN
jgi:phosphoribosylglycinamide formyltransferase-1